MSKSETVIRDREHERLHGWPAKRRALGELARWDRPIGAWLLFWPCAWGVALAPGPLAWWLVPLFLMGAFAMRGAGCTINDLVDRKLDGHVARTATRPLPSGRITVPEALGFVAAQCLVGLVVLVFLPPKAQLIALLSVPLIVIYPFMKRVTWWPQAFLGITFNWGALVGWTAATGELQAPALALYAAGIAWTLGYDTIYAHQDKEDDALIGIRSTARLLGDRSRWWVAGFYAATVALLALALWLAEAGPLGYAGLIGVALALAWQVRRWQLDDAQDCLARFRMNRDVGLVVTLALLLGRVAP
ncbi:MAG: 4-hydroxybenzoate octaprenyltransferase [Geminicoccaceae bacterium]|nr:MAG: 4-hydroxybenzoate octaprenyltransferase [Geminicoccaceae bacterium]